MAVVVIRDEKNLRALVGRVLPATASKAATDRAVAAIREANPGLELGKLRPGMVVVVPALPDARTSIGDVVAGGIDDVTSAVKDALNALGEAAQRAGEQARADSEEAARVFSSAEVQRATRGDADLEANLASLKDQLDADLQSTDADVQALRAAVGAWSKDIAALRRLGR